MKSAKNPGYPWEITRGFGEFSRKSNPKKDNNNHQNQDGVKLTLS
jgi:hypothetical protein